MKQENMKETPAFIWDLDGTLLDSYKVIVPGLHEACGEFGIEIGNTDILREVITNSVNDFLKKIEQEYGIPFDALMEKYTGINGNRLSAIMPMENAVEILKHLHSRGIPNFVFTHRGASTETVLKNTGLYGFFEEIVTGTDGFARKPDPSALLYLIRKYGLNQCRTYYVGDRTVDMKCANRAGIPGILYLPESNPAKATGLETHIIGNLMEIAEILARTER